MHTSPAPIVLPSRDRTAAPSRQPARRRAVLLAAVLALAALPALRSLAFATGELVIETGEATHRFTIELAATPDQRAQGLMHRQSMPADHGMLFDFQDPQPVGFWMKNTPLPLDMLFIDAQGGIVQIEADTTPFSERPIICQEPVRAVLELNAGTSARLGIVPGAKVRHPIFGGPD
jgi:uncharacterized membrane protein (UPF0127 family)